MQLRQFPDKNRFFDLAKSANAVPVCAEILADTVTPVTLLKTFYDNGQPLFLLESVEGGERWGRYSFLGISTRYRVRVFSEHISIDGNHQNMRQPHGGNPLALLKSMMARFRPARYPSCPISGAGWWVTLLTKWFHFLKISPTNGHLIRRWPTLSFRMNCLFSKISATHCSSSSPLF